MHGKIDIDQPGRRGIIQRDDLDLVAALQLYIPTLGHATIMVVQKILAWVFMAFFLVVAIMILGKAQFTGGQTGSFGVMTVGFALMVSAGGLSWANTGSDYSRYLPSTARPSAIIWWASLGGMLPAIVLEIVGAAVASVSGIRVGLLQQPASRLGSSEPRRLHADTQPASFSVAAL